MSEKYFLKLDISSFFPGGNVPDYIINAARHMSARQNNYNRARILLIQISGTEKLVDIIEAESDDYDRRMAFFEITTSEILNGADYSKCDTIEDMAEVYSGSLLRRLGF
jgi:hypothetical protein